MTVKDMIILTYQDNFADNLSSYAYGKILEKKSGRKCFFENNTFQRLNFENMMSDFKLDIDYISSSRVEKITQKSYLMSRLFVDEKHIKKELGKTNKNKTNILNLKHFNIDDLPLITDDIKEKFLFTNIDFVKNHDILEKITSSQSIGLYISQNDFRNENIDFDFIYRATKRLNKYIKKPKMFVFTSAPIEDKINSCIDFEIVHLNNWKEEFYFLKCCKHKILLNAPASYSQNFWASILKQKAYSINIFDKRMNVAIKKDNWIAV